MIRRRWLVIAVLVLNDIVNEKRGITPDIARRWPYFGTDPDVWVNAQKGSNGKGRARVGDEPASLWRAMASRASWRFIRRHGGRKSKQY